MNETLRPSQQAALRYQSGSFGIAAVPGSGKTFILEVLIADLIGRRQVSPERIGVFTYMRSARANLLNRINQRLRQQDIGVRFSNAFTLHSLCIRILRTGQREEVRILEQYEQDRMISRLSKAWLQTHTARWEKLLPDEDHPLRNKSNRNRFGNSFYHLCGAVIRTAKTYQKLPKDVVAQKDGFLSWATEVYTRYQAELTQLGKWDYDDLGWQALKLMEQDAGIREQVQGWYDYLFEDESQDSSPLQENLLNVISGKKGNLVRVGDPNQSIMSTFTTADPRFFREFCQHNPHLTLSESNRSAPRILSLANGLVNWVNHHHPLPELQDALSPQMIEPASTGSANPSDHEAGIRFQVIPGSSADELAAVVRMALHGIRLHPEQTSVILVSTNDQGIKVLNLLQATGFEKVVDLLRSNPSQQKVIIRIQSIVNYLAQPSSSELLVAVIETLADWAGIKADDLTQLKPWLLQSLPEALLFPTWNQAPISPQSSPALDDLLQTLASWIRAARSPWIDVLNLIVQTLYRTPEELFIGHYVIDQIELVLGDQPNLDWYDIAREIQEILTSRLNSLPSEILSFTADPGSITISTLHRSKGLEWDQVFIVGLSAYDFPVVPRDHFLGLKFLDGTDMQAEALAELRQGVGAFQSDGSATEQAFWSLAAEKLRLLYVAITRAKRHLTVTVATKDPFDNDQRFSQLFGVLQSLDAAQYPAAESR